MDEHRFRVHLAKLGERQLKVCLKNSLWGSRINRFKKWSVEDQLAFIIDGKLASLATVVSNYSWEDKQVWEDAVYPWRLQLRFTHYIFPENRGSKSVLLKILSKTYGKKYGWIIRNQGLLISSVAKEILDAFEHQQNDIKQIMLNIDETITTTEELHNTKHKTRTNKKIAPLNLTEIVTFDEKKIQTSTLQPLIEEIDKTQYKSHTPEKFEHALEKAFKFLGFDTKEIGGGGDTDVLVMASLGRSEGYIWCVDGKTSRKGMVSEAQIRWDSLEDHKTKNSANAVIIIGPDFAKGKRLKHAEKHPDFRFVTVSQLKKLLKTHEEYPLTLIQIRNALLNESEVPSIPWPKILNEVVCTAIEQQRDARLGYFSEDSITASNKRINQDQIKWAIGLLEKIRVIKEVEKRRYVLTMMPKELNRCFNAFAQALLPKTTPTMQIKTLAKPTPRSERKLLKKGQVSKGRAKKGEITPQSQYAVVILETLLEMSGSGKVKTILNKLFEKMKDKMTEKDLEKQPSGNAIRWKNIAQWARQDLVNKGYLKKDSQRGIWEITEAGRTFYESGKEEQASVT